MWELGISYQLHQGWWEQALRAQGTRCVMRKWFSWDYLLGAWLTHAEHGCLLLIVGLYCVNPTVKRNTKATHWWAWGIGNYLMLGLVITECPSRTEWLSIQRPFVCYHITCLMNILEDRIWNVALVGAFQDPRFGGAQWFLFLIIVVDLLLHAS